jgi:2-keto-4-pentenoate hydratase/2-oxohepta-3-ene-1,7-dioic acid hydratase in catechol pathway
VGIYAKPEPRLLKPGDVMEAEIEAIGILRNYIKEER